MTRSVFQAAILYFVVLPELLLPGYLLEVVEEHMAPRPANKISQLMSQELPTTRPTRSLYLSQREMATG